MLKKEQLKAIDQKQVANILLKLKAGKVLTKREQEILGDRSTTNANPNQTDKGYTIAIMARDFRIDRKTLEKVLANTNPIGTTAKGGSIYTGRGFLDAWLAYNHTDFKNLEQERARLIFHQANIAQLDEDEKRGNLISCDDLRQENSNIAVAVRRVITSSALSRKDQNKILAELKALGSVDG